MPPQAASRPAPQSYWPQPVSQASVPFGSPALLLQPRQNAANTTPARQTPVTHSASAGLSTQAIEQQQHTPSNAARGTPAPLSLLSADQPSSGHDLAQSPKLMDSGKAWTPMKASADLSRQALQSKLTPGKQLPANSLIGAGLDPTTSGSTPRPHSTRRFTGVTQLSLSCLKQTPQCIYRHSRSVIHLTAKFLALQKVFP